MSIKRKKLLSFAAQCIGILLVFLFLVAAGNTVKVMKEAQGREGPGSYYKLIKLIPEGTTLEVIEKKRNWYKVKYDKTEVWISGNSITQEKKTAKKDVFESLTFG